MGRMSKAVHDIPAEEEEVEFDPELLAELDAAMEEADRGEEIPYEEFRRQMIELERKLAGE
jgi:predicted transcriptional regulator